MAEWSKTLDFRSELEIAQVQILSVTIALFISTIHLVLSPLFCLIRSSHRPVWYSFGIGVAFRRDQLRRNSGHYNIFLEEDEANSVSASSSQRHLGREHFFMFRPSFRLATRFNTKRASPTSAVPLTKIVSSSLEMVIIQTQ
ncbi:hypothetical protein J6590_097977 [Homalodisca vitripennis]|nr:hypothetical protein J6590_097977 [Homalodisca vitripennis]